jgi:hypothetical protein
LLDNTDFNSLLSRNNVVFACDNLPALEASGLYRNTSENWKQRYTATFVVPIRKNSIQGEVFELVGYICVDYKNVGSPTAIFCDELGLPRRHLRDFLLGYADSAFGILKRGRIVNKGIHIGDTYVIDDENLEYVREVNKAFVKALI